MPSADQVKALISSLTEGDEAHFFSVAMQIAAHEARLGHGKLAEEIRALIDRAKDRVRAPSKAPIPLARPRGEAAELLSVSYPNVHFGTWFSVLPPRGSWNASSENSAPLISFATVALLPDAKFFWSDRLGQARPLQRLPLPASWDCPFLSFVLIA